MNKLLLRIIKNCKIKTKILAEFQTTVSCDMLHPNCAFITLKINELVKINMKTL